MRTCRKQVQLLSDLAETILQFRIDNNAAHVERLEDVRREVRKMSSSGVYQSGIAHMLVKNHSYHIKRQITKQLQRLPGKILKIQIHLLCNQKFSGRTYNEQLWEINMFPAIRTSQTQGRKFTKSGEGIAEIIDFLLTNLFCFCLMPVDRRLKNKYTIKPKITVGESALKSLQSFESMNCKQIWELQQPLNSGAYGIGIKFFGNMSKVNEELKSMMEEKALDFKENLRKKSSTESTVTSTRRMSLYEYYDEHLNITVLSGSDSGDEKTEEIVLEIQNTNDNSDDEYQLLVMEQTIDNSDQEFLGENLQLLKQLAVAESSGYMGTH